MLKGYTMSWEDEFDFYDDHLEYEVCSEYDDDRVLYNEDGDVVWPEYLEELTLVHYEGETPFYLTPKCYPYEKSYEWWYENA